MKSNPNPENAIYDKTLRIADLGSAGGVNAIQLLRYIEQILKEYNENRLIEYYFEDLPTCDFNELIKTIHNSKLSDQFYPRCIGKSFYEKLFPPNSIHLCLSYITLHWMRNCPSKIRSMFEKIKYELSYVDKQRGQTNVNDTIYISLF